MKAKEFLINSAVIAATAGVAILIGGAAPDLVKKIRGPFKKSDYAIHVAQQSNKLTLYGTTTCPYCIAARKFLREANIPFNDMIIDRSEDAAKKFRNLKESSVPVLVSADLLVVGFDRQAYADLGKIVKN